MSWRFIAQFNFVAGLLGLVVTGTQWPDVLLPVVNLAAAEIAWWCHRKGW